MTHIEQLREQITNTLIANECALDHVTGGAPAAKEIPIPGTERVMYIGRRADVERLLATTAGEQAEPLTDARISELAEQEGDETTYGFVFNKDSGFSVISFARAIERELRAAPAASEQVQAEPIAMVSADELRDIQSCRMGVPVRGAGWRKDQTIALYIAAPIAAAPAAPSLTDEEITELMSDIYLSDYYGKGTQAYDIAIVRAALAALAKKVPAAPAAEEVRNQVQWISVDDRLPELGQEVLIWCGYRICGYRSDDKHDPENHEGWVIDFDNGNAKAITHWMHLPAAPAMKRADSTEGDS